MTDTKEPISPPSSSSSSFSSDGIVMVKSPCFDEGDISPQGNTKEERSDGGDAKAEEGHVTIRLVLLMLEMCLLTLSALFIETMLVPVLPTIYESFPGQSVWIPWLLSSYMITGGVTTPIFSAMSTKFGLKVSLELCLLFYILGSIGCSLAFFSDNIGILIAFRAVQGLGMACYILCFALINALFPKRLVNVALGLISIMFPLGSSIGLIGGGAALEYLEFSYEGRNVSWAPLFWISTPIVMLMAVCFIFTIQDPPVGDKTKKIDIIGGVLLCMCVGTFLVGITFGDSEGWDKDLTIILLVFSVVLLGMFLLWEFVFEKAHAIVPLNLMTNRALLLLCIIIMTVGYNLFSLYQTLPFYLEDPSGPFQITNSLYVGLLLFPQALPDIVVSPLSALVAKFLGAPNIMSLSYCIYVLSMVLLYFFHDTVLKMIIVLFISGIGAAGVLALIMIVISANTDVNTFATAAGVNTLFRIVGGSIGPIVSNIFINDDTSGSSASGSNSTVPVSGEWEGEQGFLTAWLISTLILSIGCVLSFFLPGQLDNFHKCAQCLNKPSKHNKSTGTKHSTTPTQQTPLLSAAS
ncbi:bicyclomycin/multidrug efflux system [Pelomyxa schiedti]|nr:bicyclomycin/multidrug efflux system [Pelomyxa schiedti]